MQIIIKLTNLECSFFYKRNMTKPKSDKIDKELLLLAQNISELISPENTDISIWDNVNLEDASNLKFHCRKTINLNFKCFDKENGNGGIPISERTIPLTLFFDIVDLGYLDEVITDRNIALSQADFNLLVTLILE